MMKSAIAPDFDVFLVILEESFTSFVAHADEPQMDWTKLDRKNGSAGAGKGLHWVKGKKESRLRKEYFRNEISTDQHIFDRSG